MYGDYMTLRSEKVTDRTYVDINTLGRTDGPQAGELVWIRGRLHNIRAKGNSFFLVVRSGAFYTAQAVHFKDKQNPDTSKELIKYAANIPLESIIDVLGVVAEADVKSCTQSSVELQVKKIFTVSRAPVQLPFLLEDAARREDEIEASQSTERPFSRVHQDVRLNNRWLDLRVPANNAIMRLQSGVCQLFRCVYALHVCALPTDSERREALYSDGFIEIHSPKLISGESEGGSDVFRTDYFGQAACLAQSPQLYKQMAISADMERVFEIGPVFRAENSNTRRHLCEFTGLDMEMSIQEHYQEVLRVLHKLFTHIFKGLEMRFQKELAVVRAQYNSEPVMFTEEPFVLHFPEAIAILRFV
jgi:aspartyl-tRNA synthetase